MLNTVTEIVRTKCSEGVSKEDFIKIISYCRANCMVFTG